MPPYSVLFDLQVHHGGKIDFTHGNYNGGLVDYIKEIDDDLYSMLDVKDDINVFGVENIESCSFYYKIPGSLELRKFLSDMDMLAMFSLFRGVSDVVMVYVEHAISSEGGVHGGTDEVVDNEGDGDGNKDENNRQGLGEDVGVTTEDGGDSGSDSDSEASSAVDFEYFAEDDALCDNVDVDDINEDLNDEDSSDGINENEDNTVNEEDINRESIHIDDFKEVDSDGESLHSPNNSGDDEPTEKYPEFDRSRNMNNVELKFGMIFANTTEFRAALREHSIQQGYQYKYKKHESHRVTVGLVEAFKILLPHVDHRFCVRHMYANFKSVGQNDKELKDLMSYKPVIIPVPGKSQWERTPFDDILPPTVLRAPGRPKKLRRKAVDEPRSQPRKNDFTVRRNPQKLSCSNCKQTGHNVRRCTTITNLGTRSSAVKALQNAWINPSGSERGKGAGKARGVGRGSSRGARRGRGAGRGSNVGVDSGVVVDNGVGVHIGVGVSGPGIERGVGARKGRGASRGSSVGVDSGAVVDSGEAVDIGVGASGPGIDGGVGASGPSLDRGARTSTGT
ncbi:hypothetical protein RJ639_004151 [Escallonia herrerae]|uniref:Transposase n=1 Tax=Escallonia herrerae TaxID=1293975 RepID=A0AA88W4V6_9ASTE|nr:hypothetical protein RJ639_004151 [Escallonia herrerae]